MVWKPIGPGDTEIWIEEESDKENREEFKDPDIEIEIEEDKENETDKENK